MLFRQRNHVEFVSNVINRNAYQMTSCKVQKVKQKKRRRMRNGVALEKRVNQNEAKREALSQESVAAHLYLIINVVGKASDKLPSHRMGGDVRPGAVASKRSACRRRGRCGDGALIIIVRILLLIHVIAVVQVFIVV
jgi:hypothetical protein